MKVIEWREFNRTSNANDSLKKKERKERKTNKVRSAYKRKLNDHMTGGCN